MLQGEWRFGDHSRLGFGIVDSVSMPLVFCRRRSRHHEQPTAVCVFSCSRDEDQVSDCARQKRTIPSPLATTNPLVALPESGVAYQLEDLFQMKTVKVALACIGPQTLILTAGRDRL